MVAVDGPNKQKPVGADNQRCDGQNAENPSVFEGTDELAPLPLANYQGHQKNKRPDHAVHEDFKSRNRFQRLPVDGAQPPYQKSRYSAGYAHERLAQRIRRRAFQHVLFFSALHSLRNGTDLGLDLHNLCLDLFERVVRAGGNPFDTLDR